jgi:DHA2 family multidrug resistance protein
MLKMFPLKQQPAAMGLWSVTTLIAPICGPILGGALCDGFGWPMIFLINVPVAAGAGFLAWRILVRGHYTPIRAPFDTVGLILLITWIGLLQIMLDVGKDLDWFASPLVTLMAVGSAIAFAAFLIWELTSDHPIVNLRVFRHRGFATATLVFACVLGGFFATNVLTPLWLQTNLGYSATQAGFATGATGILAVATAPIAAILVSRLDPRLVTCGGIAWLMITSFIRGTANTDMTFWQVWSVLVLVGAAMPAFFMPLMMLSMNAVEPGETADATGLSSFVRTLAGAFATSVVTTRWENMASAYHADIAGRTPNLGAQIDVLTGRGMPRPQALSTLNQLVDGQAVLLATNHLFWETAMVFALAAGQVWLLPRPTGPATAVAGH